MNIIYLVVVVWLCAGIKETTGDLDLCVSEKLFDEMRRKYNLKEEDKNECGFYHISDLIEIVPNTKQDFNYDEVDGYHIEKLAQILAFKKKRMAPKDIPYIQKIEDYMKEHEIQQ